MGRAAVPSGASTGAHEAVELRDGDKPVRRQGRGKARSGRSTARFCSKLLCGMDARRNMAIDQAMIDSGRHRQQEPLGANAILGCLAGGGQGRRPGQRPAAVPLCRRRQCAGVLPVPMMNIVNGGAHADNPIDIQEFMIMPVGADRIAEAVRMGSEVFQTLRRNFKMPATTPMSATKAASRPISRARTRRWASL
jgi:enolase